MKVEFSSWIGITANNWHKEGGLTGFFSNECSKNFGLGLSG